MQEFEMRPATGRVAPSHQPTLNHTLAGMHHLQRAAGNGAVAQLMEDEHSPVKDVVGRGGGSPLPTGVQRFMESRIGSNFDDVRVHTGGEAAESAKSVNAHAYTVGNDIVFNDGAYDPGSPAGMKTIAHELTHVVQQRSGPVDGTPAAGGVAISDPGDRFERAATANADRVMSSAPAAAPAVQREEEGQGGSDPSAIQREMPEEEEQEAPAG